MSKKENAKKAVKTVKKLNKKQAAKLERMAKVIEDARKSYKADVYANNQPYEAVVMLLKIDKKPTAIADLLVEKNAETTGKNKNGDAVKTVERLKRFASKLSCIHNAVKNPEKGKKVRVAIDCFLAGDDIPADCKGFRTNIVNYFRFAAKGKTETWMKNREAEKKAKKADKATKAKKTDDVKKADKVKAKGKKKGKNPTKKKSVKKAVKVKKTEDKAEIKKSA